MIVRPVFYFRTEDNRHIVKTVKFWDLKHYDSLWMDDPMLGNVCWIHDVDITDQTYEFDTEQEALRKIAELYAEQLKYIYMCILKGERCDKH